MTHKKGKREEITSFDVLVVLFGGWRLLLWLESLSRGLYDKYIVIFCIFSFKICHFWAIETWILGPDSGLGYRLPQKGCVQVRIH
jgi:hypothetical protein